MADTVDMTRAGGIVLELAAAIVENRAWLSEIDGAIGDGDHGVNMAKGFSQAAEALRPDPGSLAHGFTVLGETLLEGIGGSMGPLYGTFFLDMAAVLADRPVLDAALFAAMLRAGLDGVQDLGGARPGDKTLLDTLIPAADAFDASVAGGQAFPAALVALEKAAEAGRDSTTGMVARIGRAARLGERSRGTTDAGAASCCLILVTMSGGLRRAMVSG